MRRRRFVMLCVLGSVSLSSMGCQQQGTDSASSSQKSYQPIQIISSTGVPMVIVPGGTFLMGSENGAEDERPPHQISVSPFVMDTFEVTQDQYAALEIPDPSHFKDPKRPVEQVRWSDAALFCNLRSATESLDPCYDEISFECDFEASGYRLPTEAEWEWAARASATTDYSFGNSPLKLKSFACYAGNSKKKTDPVGSKKPNSWGLHDMQGNVLEWCHDIYHPDYYQESPRVDPRGPAEGNKRVLRGGSWKARESSCRTTARVADFPGITDACFARDTYGFRCVRRLNREESSRLQSASGASSKAPG